MYGIDLDRPLAYLYSSFRYFDKKEHHVNRFCEEDVLLMVFEGILRFSEDGKEYEIHPGEYHIQKNHTYQKGEKASDAPKYFYTHFKASWNDTGKILPSDGVFELSEFKRLMEELDRLSHADSSLTEKSSLFYRLMILLVKKDDRMTVADKMAEYIKGQSLSEITLENICEQFHFSKNHVINIFKNGMGVTPTKYINGLKLKRAGYLLEVTSETAEAVSRESGFSDYSHFYRLFLREYGISPVEWRRKKQAGIIDER